ncbi:hypothetical protein evm_008578 [Chilo suppressalis]|nr:hypothetical protein evm_008578 [Chilo suppressalis]
MLSTILSTIIYIVPLIRLRDEMPLMKIYFNSGMVAASISIFVACCLLIIAESRKMASLMWPFVVVAVSSGVPLTLLCLYGSLKISFRAEDQPVPTDAAYVISSYFTFAVFLLYSAIVVNSRRRELLMELIYEANKRVLQPIKEYTDDVV